MHEASAGRYRYLGSWHTHPFGRASPSATDVAAARSISLEVEVRVPRPLLIIQATWPTRTTFRDRNLRAFRWQPMGSLLAKEELRRLRPEERRHPDAALDWGAVVR